MGFLRTGKRVKPCKPYFHSFTWSALKSKDANLSFSVALCRLRVVLGGAAGAQPTLSNESLQVLHALTEALWNCWVGFQVMNQVKNKCRGSLGMGSWEPTSKNFSSSALNTKG